MSLTGTQLVDLDGLGSVTRIAGNLTLRSNPELDDVTGLYGVTAVEGSFDLSYNGAITTAEAEALRDTIGITNITGEITISE